MTNSNENTLFAQKEQAPKHLTFSAGVKRLRSHWLSLKGRSTRKEYWLIGLCIYILVGLALNIASIILFFILPGIRSNLITTPVAWTPLRYFLSTIYYLSTFPSDLPSQNPSNNLRYFPRWAYHIWQWCSGITGYYWAHKRRINRWGTSSFI